MRIDRLVWLWFLVFSVVAVSTNADDQTKKEDQGQESQASKEKQFLDGIVGQWEGTCKTWFQPGKLADESKISGEFRPLLGGQIIRHTYQGKIRKRSRFGEETIVFNRAAEKFEIAWFDSFHMNYALMFSVGEATEHGFTVFGQNDAAPGHPRWGWKTVFDQTDADHLIIASYNVTPQGEAAKAIEVHYTRKAP